MERILTITMNPALDIVTTVERVEPWRKLRGSAPEYFAGGGGVNVSQVIARLGGESTAFMLASGPTGELVRDRLEAAGVDTVLCASEGATRPSVNVRERSSGDQFRFVLEGPRQPEAVVRCARETLERLLTERRPRYVVASGSLPPGIEDGFFAELAELVRSGDARLIIDTSGAALARAVDAGVFLLTPNRNEAKRLAGGQAELEESPQALARHLIQAGRAEAVAVTLGSDGVLLATAEEMLRVRGPEVELCNPVGAGDSFVGGLSYALAQSWPLADACRYGTAAAAAAVTMEGSEPPSKHLVDELYARCSVEEIAS